MKVKAALAVILSATLAVTMMPVSAFASSTNKVSKTLFVIQDEDMPESSVQLQVDDGATWAETQTISLELTNAEFTELPYQATGGKVVSANNKNLIELKYVDNNTGDAFATSAFITNVSNIDKKTAQITFETRVDTTQTKPASKDVIYVTFPANALVATGSEGAAVSLKIENAGSDVSEGTYRLASITGGGTTYKVNDTIYTYGYGSSFEAAELMIKEKAVNSLANDSVHVLKFTLPKHYSFENKGSDNFFTNFHGTLFETKSLSTEINYTEDYGSMAPGAYFLTNNDRVLYAAFTVSSKSNAIETGYLTPIIKIDRDAGKADIKLKIEDVYASSGGNFTEVSGLTIAKSGVEGVTVSTVSNVPTVIAGQVTDTDDEFFWTEIKISEDMAGSLIDGHDIDIDLPEEAQIVTRKMDSDAGIRVSFDKTKTLDKADKQSKIDVSDGSSSDVWVSVNGVKKYYNATYGHGYTLADDTSDFTLEVPTANMTAGKKWDADTSNTLIVFVPITVKADFVGDIVAEVSSRDMETAKVTIAKAVAPVTIETAVTDVAIGMKQIPAADITLKEPGVGYWGRNTGATYITLALDDGGLANGYSFTGAKVEVTSGDLEVSKIDTGNRTIGLQIKGVSESTPGTIKISGININMARQLPQGNYNVKIVVDKAYEGSADGSVAAADPLSAPTNDAIVENAQFDDGAFGVETAVTAVSAPYINVLTAPETNQTGIMATFSLNSANATTYTVNSVTYEMDAAAFIDSNYRTMVPIRYVAYALGLTDSDISYDVDSSTATISGLTNVVRVTTGSNVLRCSVGSNVTMDTVAVNYAGRLYVPARFIAQALGAEVSWDQETQTVTITQ